jgi:hypothetical protein
MNQITRWCHHTWLGKHPVNGGFYGKIMELIGDFPARHA